MMRSRRQAPPLRGLMITGALPLCLMLFLEAGAIVTGSESVGQASWTAQLNGVIDGPNYKHAHWGLLVTDLQSGQILYERAADKLFAPASTTKLYSVAAALDAFGPEYVFETPLYARGETTADGRLEGDLILVPSGDLTLGGRTDGEGRISFRNSDHTYANGSETSELTQPDPLAGLRDLASQVAAAGIKRIQGDVLIDDRLFEPASSSGSGPSRVTPVVLNDNLVDILVAPAGAGSPATVTYRPESIALRVDAQVDTVQSGRAVDIQVTGNTEKGITVRGQIPAGHKPVLRVLEVGDPPSFARALLIEALRAVGVIVQASPLEGNRAELLPGHGEDDELRQVAVLRSPPFREEARLILKVSHNLHASTLPLLLAVKNGQRTLEQGLQMERDFLARVGVDVNTISFGGGAGGTRSDYTTPRATVQLLRGMAKRPDFDTYKSALPVLGRDGTLSTAVGESSPARGKAFAKTGTLLYHNLLNGDYVLTSKALAGYLTTRRDRQLAFAIFVNNTHLRDANDTVEQGRVLGKLCEILFEGL